MADGLSNISENDISEEEREIIHHNGDFFSSFDLEAIFDRNLDETDPEYLSNLLEKSDELRRVTSHFRSHLLSKYTNKPYYITSLKIEKLYLLLKEKVHSGESLEEHQEEVFDEIVGLVIEDEDEEEEPLEEEEEKESSTPICSIATSLWLTYLIDLLIKLMLLEEESWIMRKKLEEVTAEISDSQSDPHDVNSTTQNIIEEKENPPTQTSFPEPENPEPDDPLDNSILSLQDNGYKPHYLPDLGDSGVGGRVALLKKDHESELEQLSKAIRIVDEEKDFVDGLLFILQSIDI